MTFSALTREVSLCSGQWLTQIQLNKVQKISVTGMLSCKCDIFPERKATAALLNGTVTRFHPEQAVFPPWRDCARTLHDAGGTLGNKSGDELEDYH